MSEWKKYRFSDFVAINPTVSLKGTEDYSFVEMKDLKDGNKFCFPNAKRKTSSGARFQDSDTLFARITPCLENGKICQVRGLENGVGFGSTEFLVFRGKKNISNNDYIFYLSRWDEVRGFAESNFEGTSGRQRVNKNCFDNLVLELPNLIEQIQIASILSSLDDKIDLLYRQNKTLEQLAETLFRQLFMEEAEDNWEEVSLGEYISVKHGYAFKGNCISTEPTDLILVTPGNFKIGGGFKFDKFKYYISDDFPSDYIFKTGDMVVTMTDLSVQGDSLGYPAIIPENHANELYLHNQRIGKIEFKKEISKSFIYQLMKTRDYQWFILGGASGTSIRHTSPTSICAYSFSLPPKEKLLDFEQFSNGLLGKIKSNQNQIRTLTQLRDTLLPKLMSGEVQVKNK